MQQYLELLEDILENGYDDTDRTGTGCRSVFGRQMRFDLSEGFPLVTTRKIHTRSMIHELLWFLKGETNIRYLKENGVSIWDEWVKEGTEEYRPLSIEERYKLLKAKGIDKIRQSSLSGHFLSTVEGRAAALEDHHRWFDQYDIPRETLSGGELGPVYGVQWRSWPDPRPLRKALEEIAEIPSVSEDECQEIARAALESDGIDQIKNLIDRLKTNPDCRRLIVSAWNVGELSNMALAPCHVMFQFYTRKLEAMERWVYAEKNGLIDTLYGRGSSGEMLHKLLDEKGVPTRKLSCMLTQRSCDLPVGGPYNVASYALLTMMVAQVVNMVPGEFIWSGGNCHIYSDQIEGVIEQLKRTPLPLPVMKINPNVKDIDDFKFEDFELVGYEHHPHIPYPVAV